jgi:hypothetical protein
MLYPGQSLGPSEIEALARVCRTVCKERGLSLQSTEAERTAAHLLKLLMNGLTREEELLDAERNRLAGASCSTASLPPSTAPSPLSPPQMLSGRVQPATGR